MSASVDVIGIVIVVAGVTAMANVLGLCLPPATVRRWISRAASPLQ